VDCAHIRLFFRSICILTQGMTASPTSISFTLNIIQCYWPLSLLSAAVLIFNEGASMSGCHFSAALVLPWRHAGGGQWAWPIIFHLNQIRQAFSATAQILYLFSNPPHLHFTCFKCYTKRESERHCLLVGLLFSNIHLKGYIENRGKILCTTQMHNLYAIKNCGPSSLCTLLSTTECT